MRVPCQGPSFLVPGLPPATCRLCSKGQISARRHCCRSEPHGHLARPRHLRGGGGPGGREARAGEARDGRTAAAGASAPRRATVRRIALLRGWARGRQRSLCPPWPRAETAPRGAPLPGSRRAPVTPGLRLRPAARARGEGASFCGAGNTSEEPGRGGGGAAGPAPPRRQPVLGRGHAGGCWRRPAGGEACPKARSDPGLGPAPSAGSAVWLPFHE